MSRQPKVRVVPVTVTVGYRGEIVAGNGRVVCTTGWHLTRGGALHAAENCNVPKPVAKMVRDMGGGV